MKLKLVYLLSLLLLFINNVNGQQVSNLLGNWTGTYEEDNGINKINANCSLTFRKAALNEAEGILTINNFSDGRKNIEMPVKATYLFLDGDDNFGIDYRINIKNSSKKSKGSLGFRISHRKGRRVMAGIFFPNEKTDKPDDLMIILKNDADLNATAVVGIQNKEQPESSKSGTSPKINVVHLSANPVQVIGDHLYDFNDGYAVVMKGSSFCLIDKNGKIAVPYNKYKLQGNILVKEQKENHYFLQGMPIDFYGFVKGRLQVQDPVTNLWGMLDDHLNLIIPCKYKQISCVDDFGYIRGMTDRHYPDEPWVMFDINGKILATGAKAGPRLDFNIVRGPNGKYGYVDDFGNLKIPYEFDTAKPFHDGMAAVGKNDQYNILKWGYINTSGKLQVPYTYTIEPGTFYEGRALVIPAVTDEFEFAYINKVGAIVLKIKSKPNETLTPTSPNMIVNLWARRPRGVFVDGYAIWNHVPNDKIDNTGMALMDTSGKITSYLSLLKQHGWPLDRYNTQTQFINNEVLISSFAGVKYDEIWAIANIKGEILVATTLKEGGVLGDIHSLFDPVSGLASVYIYDSKTKTNGYIDRNGEIKIVLAPPSKW